MEDSKREEVRVLGDKGVMSEVNVGHKGSESGGRGEMSRGIQGKLKGRGVRVGWWGVWRTIVGMRGGGGDGFGRRT